MARGGAIRKSYAALMTEASIVVKYVRGYHTGHCSARCKISSGGALSQPVEPRVRKPLMRRRCRGPVRLGADLLQVCSEARRPTSISILRTQ